MSMKSEDKYILSAIALLVIIAAALGTFAWGVYQAVGEVIDLIARAL